MSLFKVADLGGRTSSEVVSDLVPGARLVKAYNTLTPEVLGADPGTAGGRRVIFISGDDKEAKNEVSRINNKIGFTTIDLGGLANGGKLYQFPGGLSQNSISSNCPYSYCSYCCFLEKVPNGTFLLFFSK